MVRYGQGRRVVSPARTHRLYQRVGGPNPQPGPNPATGPGRPGSGNTGTPSPQPGPSPVPPSVPALPSLPSFHLPDLRSGIPDLSGVTNLLLAGGQVVLGITLGAVGLVLVLGQRVPAGELGRGVNAAARGVVKAL